MCIFFLCCHSSADMTFGFIHINNLAGFCRKCRIHLAQPVRDILVNGRFWNSVMFGSLPHSCLMFNDIVCDFHGSFFNISFQKNTPAFLCLYSLCKDMFAYYLLSDLLPTKTLLSQPVPQQFHRVWLQNKVSFSIPRFKSTPAFNAYNQIIYCL